MARTNFENLRVYQLSKDLADEIWDIVLGWDNFAKDTVGKQIVHSADSIDANIAEGEGCGVFKTLGVSLEFQEVRCRKRSIGFDAPSNEIC